MRPLLSERFKAVLVRAGLAVWIAAGLVVLAASARTLPGTAAAQGVLPALAKSWTAPRALEGSAAGDTVAYQPDYSARTGTEIVMVFIGASFCGAGQRPGFPETLERGKLGLSARARADGKEFRAMAVSLDWDTDSAMVFLEPFGRWDEIAVGSNWLNESALRFIWRDHPGQPVVPQMLILERSLNTGDAVSIADERVLKRLLGVGEISAWVQAGARI